MDLCADAPVSDSDRELGMSIPSSNIVYLISLDRSAEEYYGLRVRAIGGSVWFLSSCQRLIDY
jgi:hypothetical protein